MWLPEDVEAALAWQADRDARCGGCGHLRSESMDSEREKSWKPRLLKCHVCATRSAAMNRLAKDGDPAGAYVVVEEE